VPLIVVAALGALIASNRSRNLIGWLFCLAGLSAIYDLGLGLASVLPRTTSDWPIAAGWLAWFGTSVRPVPFYLWLTLVPLLFPTGRPPSARWNPVVWAAVVVVVLGSLGFALAPGSIDLSNRAAAVENPLVVANQDLLATLSTGASILLGVPIVVTCICAVVLRFRDARDKERQQFRLFSVGASLLSASIVSAIILWRFGVPPWITDFLLGIGITAYAAAIAVAILRYRLYTIDFILNRTLVYGFVTIALGAVLLVLMTASQAAAEAWTGQRSDLLPALSGLVAAVAFQPLRRRARALADRILPARQELALLFTDIVSSTERLAAVGDTEWRDMLERYRSAVRRELRRYAGSEMHIAGDSFFATFTDPWRATECAQSLVPTLRDLGLTSRFGLHWGACEMRGEEVSGLAVWAGARVMAAAGPDEIVISDAMRQQLGAAVNAEDRGIHTLKGIPGVWRLHTLTA
jgi:class 3 adenylate cyclase